MGGFLSKTQEMRPGRDVQERENGKRTAASLTAECDTLCKGKKKKRGVTTGTQMPAD